MPSGYPKSGVNKGWFSSVNRPPKLSKEQYLAMGKKTARKMRGRKHSEEHKKKISESMVGVNRNEFNPSWKRSWIHGNSQLG